jgi:hypothetical protein
MCSHFFRNLGNIFIMETVWAAMMVMLVACQEVHTDEPEVAYARWSDGAYPPMDVHLVQGRYGKRAQAGEEYQLYLELYAPKYWMREQISQHQWYPCAVPQQKPSGAPDWYRPEANMVWYAGHPALTLVAWDSVTGHVLINSVQH